MNNLPIHMLNVFVIQALYSYWENVDPTKYELGCIPVRTVHYYNICTIVDVVLVRSSMPFYTCSRKGDLSFFCVQKSLLLE